MGTWNPARDQKRGESEEKEIEKSQRDQMQY